MSWKFSYFLLSKLQVKFYDCDYEINEDQIWIMLNSNPTKKFTTTTTTTTKSPSPTINTSYRCGKDFNNKSCSKGECCIKLWNFERLLWHQMSSQLWQM